MKKIINILAALVLSLVNFLPFAQTNVFAAGEPKSTTVTIVDGINYTTDEQGPMPLVLDGEHQIQSGGTFHYLSNDSGEHTLVFSIAYEFVLGYDLTDVKLDGTSVPATSLGEGRYSITIGEAASYNLGIFMEPKSGPTMHTVIWANPDVKDEIEDEDMLIRNGYAKVIAVYDEEGNPVGREVYSVSEGHPVSGLVDGFGHIQALPGWKIVFEFTPVYGYQLFSVKANGVALAPQEAINQYTFTMPNAHIHFEANFAKTDNAVLAESDKVTGGTIDLSTGTIDAGTVQLSIDDADVSAAKIADFDEAAAGYSISDILNIDLYNVFYKGKDDSSDVWSNQLHELDGEATITLKLADGVDVSRVVIVHNINDGDEFEIIKIDSYDAEAHTITFKAKSFSNFAIALSAGVPNSGFATSEGASAVSTIASVLGISAIISAAAWAAIRFSKK